MIHSAVVVRLDNAPWYFWGMRNRYSLPYPRVYGRYDRLAWAVLSGGTRMLLPPPQQDAM